MVKIRYILACFTDLSMDYASIAILAGTLLTAAKYGKGKAKAKQLTQLLSEVIEAAEDDKVSEEEFQQLVCSTKQLLGNSEE